MARMSRMEMLNELDRELSLRIGKIERNVQLYKNGVWSEHDDAYVDGIEFALAVISDMKDLVKEEAA